VALRQLETSDDVSTFCSGNAALDTWLRKYGCSNQHHYGVSYVAVDDDGAILGFVTVAPTSVARNRIGGGGPDTWPALLLARMAVQQEHQKGPRRIGELLLQHVFTLAAQQHLTTGCAAVVVDAKPEAVAYYQRYGFKRMRLGAATSAQTEMYIAIKKVMAAVHTADA